MKYIVISARRRGARCRFWLSSRILSLSRVSLLEAGRRLRASRDRVGLALLVLEQR
jgi:hypothetical protein